SCCYKPNNFLVEHLRSTLPEATIGYTMSHRRAPCQCKCRCLDDPECQAVTILKPEALKFIEDGHTCLFSRNTDARDDTALEENPRATTYFKKGCLDVSCGENQECIDDTETRAATCSCTEGHVQAGRKCVATCSIMSETCSRDNEMCTDNGGKRKGVCTCVQGYVRIGDDCLGTCSTMNCTGENKICEDNGGTSEGWCVCPSDYAEVGDDCLPTCSQMQMTCLPDTEICEDSGGTATGYCKCKGGFLRDDQNNCAATCSQMSCEGDNEQCEDNDGKTEGTCECKWGFRRDEKNICIDKCGNFTSGDQQFLVLKNEHKNWNDARKKCEEMGLDLAEPKDYKAVVDYLDENC
ncbi:unnamed protein product, partial [Meganyctiphanes norvegica]